MKYKKRVVKSGPNGGYFVTVKGKRHYLPKSVIDSCKHVEDSSKVTLGSTKTRPKVLERLETL